MVIIWIETGDSVGNLFSYPNESSGQVIGSKKDFIEKEMNESIKRRYKS